MELPELGNWLKPEDLDLAKKNERNEVVAVILDEGELIADNFKEGTQRLRMKISYLSKTDEAVERDWSMNWTSRKNLQTGYGKDTKLWVGRNVFLWTEPRTFEGKTTRALFGRPDVPVEQVKLG